MTGEAEVFDAIYARHDDAVAAGVALVPGVGFDVVPTAVWTPFAPTARDGHPRDHRRGADSLPAVTLAGLAETAVAGVMTARWRRCRDRLA